eukprot:1372330-Amorphochlora_amoeboformis.AAC.1
MDFESVMKIEIRVEEYLSIDKMWREKDVNRFRNIEREREKERRERERERERREKGVGKRQSFGEEDRCRFVPEEIVNDQVTGEFQKVGNSKVSAY